MHPLILFFGVVVGCGSTVLGVNQAKRDTGDASEDESDSDGGSGGDADGGPEDDAPLITFAQAICERTGLLEEWFFNAAATDPQGIESIKPGGLVSLWLEGTRTDTEVGIVCDPSTGFCEGAFSSEVVGVQCYQAAQYEFQFIVFDDDNNPSEPFTVSGTTD